MAEISDYVAIAKDLIDDDRERDALYSGIDDMWHGNWQADAELKALPDFREVIDLSPHDALRAGTTIMATSFPKWQVQPFATNDYERARAEEIEYILDWHFRQMSQRGTGTILWDLVHSALRYDSVAIWLDYLPYWTGADAKGRYKRAMRNGPFVATVHNPRFIHIRKDTYGENLVLHASNKSAIEVANYWKSRNEKQSKGLVDLLAAVEVKEGNDTYFNNFDMMLYDENDQLRRVVWGNISEVSSLETISDAAQYVLMDEVVPYPFMNWIVKIGGSNMETESKYSVHPLLAPLYWTHKWIDQNMTESLVYSEIVKYARAPRVLTETPDGGGLDIDYQNGAAINARAGQEKASPWKPAEIDQNMKELLDRGKAAISSATLPRILQNPEFAGNTPFASVNAIMQTAIGTMNTAKILCESATQEMGLRMLEWAHYNKDTLSAYRTSDTKTPQGVAKEGAEINLTPADFHPDHLLIKCTFAAEVPTDYMQRLNAATLMVERLDYPKKVALEELGKSNADILVEQRQQEKYDEVTIAADQQTIMGEAQLSIQAKQMQLQLTQQVQQMQMQQQMQQQVQQQQMGGGAPAMPQGGGAPPQGGGQQLPMEAPPGGGQGFNENAGGMSPATANPAVNNRESVTGQTQGGAPIS